jgi:hypothetical protein
MSIDSIEIHHYRLPLDPPFNASWDPRPRTSHTSTIVRVRAGDYEGVGSGDAMLGFAGHEYLFLGTDPFDIERHVRLLDSLQFNYGRMWPLEVALWDLMGKITGQPLWKLLRAQQRVRVRLHRADVRPERRRDETGAQGSRPQAASTPPTRAPISPWPRPCATPSAPTCISQDANQAWRMPWDASRGIKTAVWVAALAELSTGWKSRWTGTTTPVWRRCGKESACHSRAKATASSLSSTNICGTGRWTFISRTSEHAHPARPPDRAGAGCRRDLFPHTWGDGLVLLANLHVRRRFHSTPSSSSV